MRYAGMIPCQHGQRRGRERRSCAPRQLKARTEADIYREGRPKLSAIADLVDDMPMEMFLEYVTAGRIGSRKAFCEALGISESTLSGWVK